MRVGVDIRVLARGTRTGVEEYVINLLSHLPSLDRSVTYHLFYNAYHKSALEYSWLTEPNVVLKDMRLPNRPLFAVSRWCGLPKFDRLLKGVDVYFNPHFFSAPVSCRKVVTFHDLSFERYPEFFSIRKRLWQKVLTDARQEARQADKIIAVSESTKDDLINLYCIEPEKIKVVYSGVDERFRPIGSNDALLRRVREKYCLPADFILYFGTIEPRKNLVGLVKAFDLLKTNVDMPNLKLVMAGAKGWSYQHILKAVKTSAYQRDILFTGFVDDFDKPELYNLAALFVYPSFFEGFGFPPLEAMACGLPTIVSYASSLPEVAGPAAIMVDPYDIDELAWAMELALTDEDARRQLSQAGLKQAREFSWLRCAQKMLDIFKETGA